MKIPAPNYTQTPNVCFDEIFKTLKEGELRVILVLIRQTFGWHKPYDRISLSQLAEKTGMERKSICRSLNSLIEKGLIEKKKFGDKGKERCYFSLVVDILNEQTEKVDEGEIDEEEMQILSSNSYQCPKDTRPVSQGHYPSVPRTPTKETNTKETIQKKQQQQYVKFAAADSLSKEEKETCQPKIHDILLKIDIPESDKIEITEKYPSIEIVKKALDWALHPETTLTKGLAPALKWACKYQPEMPLSKKATEEKNKIDPTYYNKSYWRQINVALFKLGINPNVTEYEDDRYLKVQDNKVFYKDMSFLEQISNFLRKISVQDVSIFKMIDHFQYDLSHQ